MISKTFAIIATFFLITTNGYAEEISLNTEDGFLLPATLKGVEGEDARPAVILIHQGGSDRSEWEFMHEALIAEDYVILSYDIRGMGASPKDNGQGKVAENIYNATDQATIDLKAAITLLEGMEEVDNARIGILGASVGGNLAVVGAATMNIKSAVAISGKTDAVHNLAGNSDIKMKSTYYISSMESDGARAVWAEEMFNMTASPREIAISPNEQGHGVTILQDMPILQEQVISWFKKTL